jgi:glycosyltransferase involved in cell wall biosynthesis
MRIAQIATLATPVRQERSDSIEYLVWLLTRELTRLGHEVTVFAARGSVVDGELVATLPGTYGSEGVPDDWQLCEWINLCRAIERSDRFDVLHSHAYLWGLPIERLARAPMVHTFHLWPYENEARLRALVPDACVTAISKYQWSAHPQFPPAAVIHHGVDCAQFTLQREPKDYVAYLGRFTEAKGPLQAIAVARALGLRLLLAGPADDYYRRHVAPHVDGRQVEYVGYVSGAAKNQFLGGARALLYPLRDPEPFGLVQVEAMLCGTPVVGMRVGAAPEIIDDGVTGYCANSLDEFREQVPRSFTLDRPSVRARAEARFSAGRMAQQYVELYERLVSSNHRREDKSAPGRRGRARERTGQGWRP